MLCVSFAATALAFYAGKIIPVTGNDGFGFPSVNEWFPNKELSLYMSLGVNCPQAFLIDIHKPPFQSVAVGISSFRRLVSYNAGRPAGCNGADVRRFYAVSVGSAGCYSVVLCLSASTTYKKYISDIFYSCRGFVD